MPCTAESCRDGLTPKCFDECPEWALRAFAYRLLHLLVRAEITRRLPKGLGECLIAPGVEIPAGIIIPPGTTISPATVFPPGWTYKDPVPPGVLPAPSYFIDPIIRTNGLKTLDAQSLGFGPPEILGEEKIVIVLGPTTLGMGPDALLGGGSNTGGTGIAGCGCCYNADDPALFVGIGYETTEMELSETQELTVTDAGAWCEGKFYEWLITKGGGELSVESGLDVIYTAPTSGHGCPGNTEITLFCCGEVMDTLDITINYEYAIDYNYETSAAEIDRNSSEVIYVTANNTPLSWSVEGTGFSLEHTETDGCGNVLHADGTACGVATITITGCDESVAVGRMKCSTGQWIVDGAYAASGCQNFNCGLSTPFIGTSGTKLLGPGNIYRAGYWTSSFVGSPPGGDLCEDADAASWTYTVYDESTYSVGDIFRAVFGGTSPDWTLGCWRSQNMEYWGV